MVRKPNFGADSLDTPGQRIRFIRQSLGFSQEALAAKVFATQPAVSQWENDHWLPSRQSQALLAQALNTSRAFLFGDAVSARAVAS